MNSEDFISLVASKCSAFFKEMHELSEAYSQQPSKKKGGRNNNNNNNNNNHNNSNNNHSNNAHSNSNTNHNSNHNNNQNHTNSKSNGNKNTTPAQSSKPTPEARDPNLPKKPPTAYILYFKHRKEIFIQQYPNTGITEITKLIAKEWGELTKDQQIPFLKDAESEKNDYIVRMKAYASTHPEVKIPGEGRKRKSRPSGPVQQEPAKKPSEGVLNESSDEAEEEDELVAPPVETAVSSENLQTGLINEDDSFDDVPLPTKKMKA